MIFRFRWSVAIYHVGQRFFFISSSEHGLASLQGSAISDAIKPVADFLTWHDACRSPNQNKKSGLKGILGVRLMTGDSSADAKNHRSMPTDERLEGGVVPLPDEAFQQLTVGQPAAIFEQHCPTNAVQNMVGAASSHKGLSKRTRLLAHLLL